MLAAVADSVEAIPPRRSFAPRGTPSGCSPAQSAAVTAMPGIVFSGSNDGHLRGYSTEDGKILWDFDTTAEFQTVNGVKAKGGSLDGPGAVVVHGMVFVEFRLFRLRACRGMCCSLSRRADLEDPAENARASARITITAMIRARGRTTTPRSESQRHSPAPTKRADFEQRIKTHLPT